MRWTTILLCGWFGVALATGARAEEWPQFRGPAGDGVSTATGLPVEWNAEKNLAWQVELPGLGWSQPVVWGDRIFLTTAEHADERPFRFDWSPGVSGLRMLGIGSDPAPPKETYRWHVLCLEASTGKTLWDQVAHEGPPTHHVHPSNSYASETAATDGERVIASFGMSGVYCYDFAGKPLWSKELGTFPMQYGWGTGSSPVLLDDRVFLQCDNDQQSFLVALDKRTGNELWRVGREERSNWSTPYVWRNERRTELVAAGGGKMRSYDPATGALLWELTGDGRTASTPVGTPQILLVDSYDRTMGRSGRLIAIRPGGSGDLSADGDAGPFIAWSTTVSTQRVASPLVYEGCVYVLEQISGLVRCLDAGTGKPLYRQRLPGASGFTASPWAAAGKVYCLDQNGLTTVLAAGPKYQLLASNPLDGLFWASAGVAGERLLLRSANRLYCVGP